MRFQHTGFKAPKHTRVLLSALTFATFFGMSALSYADTDQDEVAAEQAAPVLVSIEGGKFVPNKITIHVGDTVVWQNITGVRHTVTADKALARNPSNILLPNATLAFNSGLIGPREAFNHTFTEPGLYQYVCLPHELHGMIGQVEVVP